MALRSDAARGKALEVIKTLSSRVKSSTGVALPVVEIYEVFANAEASPYEKNVALMFLEMGWKRAEPTVQAKLVLRILPNIASHAEQYQITLLQVCPFMRHFWEPFVQASQSVCMHMLRPCLGGVADGSVGS